MLMSLILYLYDQDNSGKIFADNFNLSCESDDKVAFYCDNLVLYENVALYSLVYGGLLESPIWFFLNSLCLIRVQIEEYSAWHSLKISSYFYREYQDRVYRIESCRRASNADTRVLIFIRSVLETLLP